MKLAESPPRYCAACHGQYPKRKHVDFEAYYDGPVINEENNIKMGIDDLVLCEECLSNAAMLIGMVNKKEWIKENFELGKAVEKKNDVIKAQNQVISDLEHTVKTILDGKGTIKRSATRPKLRVPQRTGT